MSEFKLQDRIFDPEASRISSYFCHLFLLIGRQSIQYSILDPDSNTFIALAGFRPDRPGENTGTFTESLARVIESEPALLKKYPSVVIGIDTPFHSLVPTALFDKDQIMTYLKFYFKMGDGIRPGFDRIPEADAMNAFGFSVPVAELTAKYFKDAVTVHRGTAFLKTVFQASGLAASSTVVFLNMRLPDMDLAVLENKRLTFYNTFSVKSHEDILYYTLYTLEQISAGNTFPALYLCGNVEAGTGLPRLLEEYIGPVRYLPLPSGFNYSPLIGQANAHFYTELFGLALCGS